MKYLLILVFIVFLWSCSVMMVPDKKNDNNNTSTVSLAIPIYNQAYQENCEKDNISDIKNNARNAYVLLDPFEAGVVAHIPDIKANNNEVGAYISIGTGENYRDDFEQIKPYLVARPWGDWPDEFFVNSTTTGILEIMKARIDKIAAWGFDWVEFDNMDWVYDNELRAIYNFQVTKIEGIKYYQELCDYVHSKGMKCMAKNTVESASDFDGVLYESEKNNKNWWDESGAQRFLDAGKLVIVNHYNERNCEKAYMNYKGIYNQNLSFICEDAKLRKYVHFNQ